MGDAIVTLVVVLGCAFWGWVASLIFHIPFVLAFVGLLVVAAVIIAFLKSK